MKENNVDKTRIIIRPTVPWKIVNFGELWQYRDLIIVLMQRDIRLRYKQTALGVAWVFLQPIVPALIFSIVFGLFAQLPSNGKPYGLFVFSGMLIWSFFANTLQRAGNSLVGESRLISKVYFPRLVVPLASMGAVFFDFVLTSILLVPLQIFYHIPFTWQLLILPLFVLQAILAAAGISFWFSALNVRYRDFMYSMPFLIQIWLYASPVVYAASIVPRKWLWLYSLNPAVGFIEGFRWSILSGEILDFGLVLVSSVLTLVFFITGIVYFNRVERAFADYL